MSLNVPKAPSIIACNEGIQADIANVKEDLMRSEVPRLQLYCILEVHKDKMISGHTYHLEAQPLEDGNVSPRPTTE
jgi:hypothetical protein